MNQVPNSDDPLAGLNPAQKEAASALEGPVLVVAGAGAGKTKTIAHRIWHLIKHGVAPEQILAITFTNKAAKEMRERVAKLLGASAAWSVWGDPAGRPFVSTFHALGAYIIKENASRLGLIKHFAILDREDSLALIKQALKEQGIDPKTVEPRRVLGLISRAKGDGQNLADFKPTNQFATLVAQLWRRYEALAHERHALDFDDLLLKVLELWHAQPTIVAHYQNRWRYLHIDEYQDTNVIQYQLAKLLAAKQQNICVVGDVDQSIYSWRGADFKNILRFEQDYPSARVVLLEQNYRSTQTIIAAANAVIKNNRERHDKKLFTQKGVGDKIKLLLALDENDEGQKVAGEAARLIGRGVPPGEIAVLYRANFQSRALEEQFLRAGLPHRVLGTRFFDRREVKDVLAWLKAALNPSDIESFKRAASAAATGIGPATIAQLFSGQRTLIKGKKLEKVQNCQAALAEIKSYAETHTPSETVKFTLARSGIEKILKEGAEDDQERLENVRELASLALKYGDDPENLWQFLAEAALVSDQDSLDDPSTSSGQVPQRGQVSLMTVHAAKGLEFDCVFIVGLEQDLFPHRSAGWRRNDDPPVGGERDSEEERRLFYVALTRARQKLFLSYAQLRTIFGSRQVNLPSQFLGEISEELMDSEPDLADTNFIDF